jgi:hypothetical protein
MKIRSAGCCLHRYAVPPRLHSSRITPVSTPVGKGEPI